MPVKIHGKDYKTVAERVTEFHNDHKDKDVSINTEIIQFKDDIVVMKATVKIDDNEFVGHAIENKKSSRINEYNYIESAETSCIGRALASAGYLGSEFASAEEVANAINQESKPVKKQPTKPVESGTFDRNEVVGFKSGNNQGKTYKELDENTLRWLVEECSVESWKAKAIEEMNLRSQEVGDTELSKTLKKMDDTTKKASKEKPYDLKKEVDQLFS